MNNSSSGGDQFYLLFCSWAAQRQHWMTTQMTIPLRSKECFTAAVKINLFIFRFSLTQLCVLFPCSFLMRWLVIRNYFRELSRFSSHCSPLSSSSCYSRLEWIHQRKGSSFLRCEQLTELILNWMEEKRWKMNGNLQFHFDCSLLVWQIFEWMSKFLCPTEELRGISLR